MDRQECLSYLSKDQQFAQADTIAMVEPSSPERYAFLLIIAVSGDRVSE